VNTAFLNMSMKVDMCEIANIADRMGVKRATSVKVGGKYTNKIQPLASLTLGAQEVTPLAMAAAYAGFANQGSYCAPRAVARIINRAGEDQPVAPVACKQALRKEVANAVVSGLSHVFESGGTGARLGGIGRQAAGKTGTTNSSVDTWFVGTTPQFATAVWVADPDTYKGQRRQMQNIRINGRYYGALYGATIAGPTWKSVMQAAHKGLPEKRFNSAPSKLIYGSGVRVPYVNGDSVGSATSQLEGAGFDVVVAGRRVTSDEPSGRVAYTSPGGGRRQSPGSTVTIYVSSGPKAESSKEPKAKATPKPKPSKTSKPKATPKPKPRPKPKPTESAQP
jgi:membrane peptidoglycan carboxypeptidase